MAESKGSMQMGEAILWMICCTPVGMVKMGQGLKCLVWILISIVTGGIGTLAWIVDYLMCASKVAKGGTLGEWEFFPRD